MTTAFDRDASIERRQIHDISLNVARRLRQVLDRNRYVPAAMTAEVESTVQVITGIQRDIDQIMAALPADEALDFAILTHIMGGQRHALDLLEILEEKLDGGRSAYQRDSARVHQALLAVSREIEQDALRYAAAETPLAPRGAPYGGGIRQQDAGRGGHGRQAYGRHAAPRGAPPARGPKQQRAAVQRDIAASLRALAAKPLPVALTALMVGAGIVIAAQKLLQATPGPTPPETTALPAAPRPRATADTALPAESAKAATAPAMEQPYLVVLSTRRSTEELQQDYRGFKASYPDLLGSAKARVDRVQGLDKQMWYRLSLIPPRTRDEAKALCSSLRKAGLTGCWTKSVPLH